MHGVRAIELDVHPALDGTLMVIHDAKVNRTTDGHGAVADLSVEALRTLDAGAWFGAEFAGERIPLLTAVLDLLHPTDVTLNIEIKAFPPAMNVPATMVRLLRQSGCGRHVVSSFELDALLAVRTLDPGIALALLGDGPAILAAAIRHRLPWIHAHHPTVNRDLVIEAHAAGIKVNVWTVDSVDRFRQLREAGINKVCTNRPCDLMAAGV